MVKMIASDIDGTLLKHGRKELPPRLFSLIRRLREQGIIFCAASGRQYSSLRRLFEPVADEIYYICENGAVVFGDGPKPAVLGKTVMDRSLAEQLIREIVSREDCEVLISGENTSYLMPKKQEIVTEIRDFIGNNVSFITKEGEVPEPIIKVSAFCTPDTTLPEKELAPKWRNYFSGAVAGKQWLDFTLADKGKGISALCSALKIPLHEVMAFGDNYNDIPMLQKVGYPILMESAHPDLKTKVTTHCIDVPEYICEKFFPNIETE